IIVLASRLAKPSAVPIRGFSAELLASVHQTAPRSYAFGRSIRTIARAKHHSRPHRLEQFFFSCASFGRLRRAFLFTARFGFAEAKAEEGRGRSFRGSASKAVGPDERVIAV